MQSSCIDKIVTSGAKFFIHKCYMSKVNAVNFWATEWVFLMGCIKAKVLTFTQQEIGTLLLAIILALDYESVNSSYLPVRIVQIVF